MRGVSSDRQTVLDASGLDLTQADEHRLGPGFARKLETRGMHLRSSANGLSQNRSRWLHGIGMRFRTDVDRSDLPRIDAGTSYGLPGRLHRHGDRVLIRTWNGFFLQAETTLVAGRIRTPDLGDLLDLDAVAWDVSPVADDAGH